MPAVRSAPKPLCQMFLLGHCPRGNRCHMSHGGDGGGNTVAVITAGGSTGIKCGGGSAAAGAQSAAGGANSKILVTLLKLVFDITGTAQSVWRDNGQLDLSSFANFANL